MMKAVLFLLVVLAVAQAFVAPQPSLSRTLPLEMTVLTYGNKKKNFPPGSPLSKAVAQLGVKVKYSCKK